MGQRAGSFIIDGVLQAIPYVGLIPAIINWVLYRRGSTIGLSLVKARIMRENGDVSGFFHTFVRASAALLSLLPLGLGFWWAFWDPKRQTWHDKIMHTYVLRDTPELASQKGSSSTAAVVWLWVGLGVLMLLLVIVFIVFVLAISQGLY